MAKWAIFTPPPVEPEPEVSDLGPGVEAKLAHRGQGPRPKLEGPEGPSQDAIDAAVLALAAVFAQPKETFDPRILDALPWDAAAQREIKRADPIRQAKPEAWSTRVATVAADASLLVSASATRDALMILNRGAGAIRLAPTREIHAEAAFEVAAGATFSLDVTGPVYAESVDGTPQQVQVTQTYYGVVS